MTVNVLVSSIPSAEITNVAVLAWRPSYSSAIISTSDTSEDVALIDGVALHHWLSPVMRQGVFELILKTTLSGETAFTW